MERTPDETKKGLEICSSDEDRDKCVRCPYFDGTCINDPNAIEKDALALIQQLEDKVPRWISVEERLPDVDVDVVLIIPRIDGPCIRVGWLRKTGRWWAAGQGIVPYEVTHWMPLPQPPEA